MEQLIIIKEMFLFRLTFSKFSSYIVTTRSWRTGSWKHERV